MLTEICVFRTRSSSSRRPFCVEIVRGVRASSFVVVMYSSCQRLSVKASSTWPVLVAYSGCTVLIGTE